MKIITTEKQKSMSQIPTRLELLQELNKREALIHDKDMQAELNRQERGLEGEQILLDHIKDIAPNHWIVLRNVWINYFGIFECDLILITSDTVYLFEVKNYSGIFEIDQHIGKHGNKSVGNNVVSQGIKSTINLRNILQNSIHDLSVVGVIAFVGRNNQIIIKDTIKDLNILSSNEVRDFIWNIRKTETQYLGYPIDSKRIIQILAEYEISAPYPPEKDIPKAIFQNIRKGIRCGHCGNFQNTLSKKYLSCECGLFEPRKETIIRTICEYGVLNYQKHLQTKALLKFFNGDISRSNLLGHLQNNFEQIGNNKSIQYTNKGRPISKIYNHFHLPDDKFIQFKGQMPF
jgi:hypothetical protein